MLRLESVFIRQDDFSLTMDMSVPAGTRAAVIGPSGAGKSTFLGAIAGFVPVTAGHVIWDGQDMTGQNPSDRPISTLFQDNNLFPHLTAFQNIALGLKPSLRVTATEREQIDQALARVGLSGYGARKPAQLSGGQQSRVALARVLLRAQPLLLLDEPFSALGPALKSEMLTLVSDICAETNATLLMVTHDVGDARAIADKTILVADGHASGPFPTAELLDNPPPALRAYLG
ncbi:thiamine ABC transporter ATP-binding protein [Roseinatronobacter alkalisoli]|uniref:Thiamine ABC transporter ATP-binding protein n=1 Tax=Roseinatronobacter alkalisoli TaxID=3028235 RepID=A0ABT5T5B8_9RHOB|nr:thiamine ABC transporter ATP-binding protein [Roseinatronobacter sp. HJB301]MDD7969586.1 thiamine ABC transporter ATP-binding protein [Roseinatronobacter sp. HJB301]